MYFRALKRQFKCFFVFKSFKKQKIKLYFVNEQEPTYVLLYIGVK
jgi:hypothetical protein